MVLMRTHRSSSDAASPPLAELPVGLKPRRQRRDQLRAHEPLPLAAQVLRFRPEEKQTATSLKKTRFVYELETCRQATGDVFRAERRFREFKRLREALLTECRDCPSCRGFVAQLQRSRLPARQVVVLDATKYGTSRVLELTHFLRDLVRLAAQQAPQCARHGADVDKSVALFLGLGDSLTEPEDVAASSTHSLCLQTKTRQERMDFRAASMPDVRFSASSLRLSDDSLESIRARGYSMTGGGYAQPQPAPSAAPSAAPPQDARVPSPSPQCLPPPGQAAHVSWSCSSQ